MADSSGSALVLASTSRTRQRLLAAAGLNFTIIEPDIDEAVVRATLSGQPGIVEPADIAEVLARAKAEEVSARCHGALVIGADQVLACDGELFAKPRSMDEARSQLLRLRGRGHELHSAVALALAGETSWVTTDTAHLTMRQFSMAALGFYLARAGKEALDSVGAYQLEGIGVQLFERVEGDYFTILGLPLLPLLAELRLRNMVLS
jgi:septum formation protein